MNRRLAGFVFAEGALPAPGSGISYEGKDVGQLTSVAERTGGAVALGMLRVEVADEALIVTAAGAGRVSALPVTG